MGMQVTIHSPEVGLDESRRLLSVNGLVLGAEGKSSAFNSVQTLGFFDDFHGSALSTNWTYTEGTDTTTAGNAVAASAVTLTAGDSAGTVAADAAMLNSSLIYKAANGNLSFVFRVKLASIASVSAFVGFTDTLSLEAPIQSAGSADTITTNATDAVGIMFDTSMTTDNWWAVGVANDVDATAYNTTYAPVADTYEEWMISVSTAGVATFYRNGKAIHKMTAAVTPSVALTPVAIVWPRSAAAGKTLVLDYAAPSVNRA